jgi:trans-2,3-dihydro-3-hydroxyanthranilate isomerase
MRMFSPAYGVAEDAATGSAAGPLAVHLARRELVPYGRRIEIWQGVEMGRPSRMLATAWGGGQRVDQVEVAGSAVVVARGMFYG